ncbi:hypothetical protein VNO77_03073 [Canavalia gladiata]|uniref:Uncharacterized protein n=1 Tax=Canavalia gladiata TaxID=3824 RepID=A0AAN9MUS1_CANGL
MKDLQLIQALDLTTVINCAAVTKELAIMGLQNVIQWSIKFGCGMVQFDSLGGPIVNYAPIKPANVPKAWAVTVGGFTMVIEGLVQTMAKEGNDDSITTS